MKQKPVLSAIAAMAENRVIGRDNDLIWHISEDLKHFKRTTLGKPIIMGRKSFESLGSKCLPRRANIVISRSYDQTAADHADNSEGTGPFQVCSIDEGIKLGMMVAEDQRLDEIFITGGGEIYKQTIGDIDRLYLTVVHREYEGDTWFPEFDLNDFKVVQNVQHDDHDPQFTIYTYERV